MFVLGTSPLRGSRKFACFGKRHEPDVGVDFAVDDDASMVEAYGGYLVEPFEGDSRDEELLTVAEAVEASEQ